ncbi:MAG: putative porin, partial [Bacteroidales bacterium]
MRLKNIYHHILVLAILLIHGIVSGQVYRSGFYPEDSLAVESFHNRLDIESPLNLQPIDTTLKDFEIYNWPDRKYPFIASLGNSGLAYKNLVFNIQRPVGFNYGINTFDAYLFQQEELKYYLNHKPFSEIGYVTGASKEQLFHARHQQRFFKKLAFGVDFELINSLGTYQHQKSNNRKIAFKSEYFTDNLKYGFIANYSHSKVVVQENGGLANDSIYEHNLEPDRSIIGIKLWNAETNVRKAQIGFQQYYQLSPRKKNDSDSAYLHDKKLQIRFGRLSHTFLYDRNALIYKDENPTSGFYHNIYVDSIATFDSVFFQTLENSFSWSNADYVDR